MRNRFAIVATVLPLLAAPSLAIADPLILFSSFGPGNTYRPGGGPILGPGAPLSEGDVSPGQLFASSFVVPAGTFNFTGVDIALAINTASGAPSTPLSVDLALVRDVNGLPGTASLATMSFTGTKTVNAGGSIESATSTDQPALVAGLTYWLVASTIAPGQAATWMASPAAFRPGFLPAAERRVDGAWSRSWPNGAFRVYAEGTAAMPTPEPGTLLLMALGLAGAMRAARRA